MHHFARAALVDPMRQAAGLLARNWLRSGGMPFTSPVEVRFVPHQKNRGTLADTANHLPACKAVLDGVVDAGVIPEDNPTWVLSQCFYPPVKAKTPGVLVMLSEATDEGG
jgi:hypothetical protein